MSGSSDKPTGSWGPFPKRSWIFWLGLAGLVVALLVQALMAIPTDTGGKERHGEETIIESDG